ncbi:retrotransposon-related protein [Tanacetum coccineum]
MMDAPVLKLPNFEKDFVVETDAFGEGNGTVLQHQGHPVAYLSKALSPKHQLLSTYEKEFLAVLQALDKLRGYLLDRHFKIKTDNLCLKYLLDQRISTPTHMKWLPKLMGFGYEIEYNRGKDNVAADALSRIQGNAQLLNMLVFTVSSDVQQRIMESWTKDGEIQALIAKPKAKKALERDLIEYFHAGTMGEHSGVKVTTHSMCVLLYWKKMRKHIKHFMNESSVCQLNKADLAAYPGLLQPLPIPQRVWSKVSMDFIDGLPASKGKTVILVVVDRLSKYSHFIPLSHPYSAIQLAQAFLDNIYKLHGLPKAIVSDRDKVFLSRFWQELFKLLDVSLHMPKKYVHWLPLVEYWYNTNYHTSINTTPFEVLYGQPPLSHIAYVQGDSNTDVVDRSMIVREEAIALLKFHLGRQISMRKVRHHKLSPKFYGPYQVTAKVEDYPNSQQALPEVDEDVVISDKPQAVLEGKTVKKGSEEADFHGILEDKNYSKRKALIEFNLKSQQKSAVKV